VNEIEEQKKRDKVLEALKKRDISYTPRAATEATEATGYTPYHKAAAVLSSFELGFVNPLSPVTEAEGIERLMADSTTSTDAQGKQCWILLPEVRRQVLKQMGTRTELLKALEANPDRSNEPMQKMLEAYLVEEAPTVTSQTIEQLNCSLQIVGWLRGIEGFTKPLPNEADLRARIEMLHLLEPFEKLAGSHFQGRKNELEQLRQYVGVLSTASLMGGLRNKIPLFASIRQKPPLMITGPGGMGKSSLVARFILDHAKLTRTQKFPFAYLDFDRPGLVAAEPATLLIEIVKQLGIQYPDVQSACDKLRQGWESALGSVTRKGGKKGISKQTLDAFLKDFRNLLQTMILEEEAFLLVLDTFEEVQYRSYRSIKGLWDFLARFQRIVPRLRTVLSGRSPLPKDFKTEPLPLANLDIDAARAILMAHEVAPESIVKTILKVTKGNPLSLRFAVKVFEKEGASSEDFFKSLTKQRIQGELYERILSHMDQDVEVIRLAHPGFVLRRITPALIKEVLAKPCKVDVPNYKKAQQLFNKLSQEITLVVPAEDGALRHQPEVRVLMLDLLREDKSDEVIEISKLAIEYYQESDDPISRAEEIYHRLSLGQDAATVAPRWIQGVEDYLYSAVEELSPAARLFLAPRLGIPFDESVLEDLEQREWELAVEQLVSDALENGELERGQKLLAQRTEWSPGSRLYTLAARIYEEQKNWNASWEMIEKGLTSLEAHDDSQLRFDLLSIKSRVAISLGLYEEAAQSLNAVRDISESADPVQRLIFHSMLLMVYDMWRVNEPDAREVGERIDQSRQELGAVFRDTPDDVLLGQTMLVRGILTVLGSQDLQTVLRCLRLIGLDDVGPAQRRLLAHSIANWDLEVSAKAGVDYGVLARGAGLPSQGDLTEVWTSFVQTARPGAILETISSLVSSYEPPEQVRTTLQTLLTSPASGQEGEPDSLEQGGAVSGTIAPREIDLQEIRESEVLRFSAVQKSRFARVLLEAFDRNGLETMLRYRLNVQLDSISFSRDLRNTAENVIDWADRHGELERLLAAALVSNPRNRSLLEFASELGITSTSRIEPDRLEELGTNDLAKFRERIAEIAGRLCRVEVDSPGNERRLGTGFLVGPDLLLTSAPLVAALIEAQVPERARFRFDYVQLGERSVLSSGTEYRLAVTDWLVDFDTSLNYALLRLEGMPGRDPIGGDKAGPGAAARGWMTISPDIQPPAKGDGIIVAHHPDGKPFHISTGSVVDHSIGQLYYDVDTSPGSGGAPVFNNNLELVAIHQRGSSDRVTESSEGTLLTAILDRLRTHGRGNILGVDYFEANVLRAGRVFIGRASLKDKLRSLASPKGPRALLVNGPRGSGKSYTSQFIFDLTANLPGNRTVYIQLGASLSYSAVDLASDIALQMGLSTQSMPSDLAIETRSRFVRQLANWLAAETMRNRSVVWWIVIDGFEDVRLEPELNELIAELVWRTETNVDQLRMVLLGYTGEMPAQISDFVLRENLQPIQRSDVEEFLREFSKRNSINENELQQLVEIIFQRVDSQLESAKDPERDRLHYLNRAVYEVVQALQSA
jgi:hypothetical protein